MSTRQLDEVRDRVRRRHYSIHIERAYRDWGKRYVHDAAVLALRGPVPDLALTPDPRGIPQRMMGLALVETKPLSLPIIVRN